MIRASRIGVLGGTLDPIHCGHVAAAVAARDALDLSAVVIIPSRVPPHRAVQPVASAYHRFAMAALAASAERRLGVSDVELRSEGLSYTADTLERLHAEGLTSAQIFFITGADAFAEIASWRRYPEVLDLANFVVVARPGHLMEALPTRLTDLAARMRPVAEEPAESAEPLIHLLRASTPDVSSTMVRERLMRGEAITGLVPPLVEAHIITNRLYRTEQLHGEV